MIKHNHRYRTGSGSMIIIGAVALLLLIGGVFYFSASVEVDQAVDDPMTSTSDPTMVDKLSTQPDYENISETEDMSLDGYMLVDEDTEIDDTFLPEAQPGEYVAYSGDSLAYAETGDVLLFFHADWCPSCRGLDSDITANMNAIPDGLSIQKIDYDTAGALKQKYEVVRQHTLVQVDASGNKIQTITGLTNTLDQVVAQVQ